MGLFQTTVKSRLGEFSFANAAVAQRNGHSNPARTQRIAGMLPFPSTEELTLFHQIGQISGCGRRRGAGNCALIARAKAALKAPGTFLCSASPKCFTEPMTTTAPRRNLRSVAAR